MQLDLFAPKSAPGPVVGASTLRVHFTLSEEMWSRFDRKGVLMSRYRDDSPASIRWLIGQLRRRVPGYSGAVPTFGYLEAADCPALAADLATADGAAIHWLEAEVPASRVVAISSYGWSRVMEGEYLALDALDDDLLARGEPHASAIEASWLRAFDLEACKRRCEGDKVMALVERVHRREVVNFARVSQPADLWQA